MRVVSVVFGKGLFEDGCPERLVRLGSVGKYSHILIISKLLKGQVVVDHDRCLDAHVVEMDGIGILGAETIHRGVNECLLKTAWHFSNSGGCSEEPTVAEATLADIIGGDTIAKERGTLVWGIECGITSALPVNLFAGGPGLTHGCPVQCILVVAEFLVRP